MKLCFFILCLIASSVGLCAEKNKAEQNALEEELAALEEELPRIEERIIQIRERLEKLEQVQTYILPIYLKLPLAQARYHWKFLDRRALLNGSLELVIRNAGGERRSTIFSEGRIKEGWRAIGDHGQEQVDENEIYFGFTSKKQFDVNRFDTAELILRVKEDIPGIGPDIQGTLPKGEYRATAQFQIFDNSELGEQPEYAYLDRDYLDNKNFSDKWDLVVTANSGWMEKVSPEEFEAKNRRALETRLVKTLEVYKKLMHKFDDANLVKLQAAYDETLREVIENKLSQPTSYWKEHSKKEIEVKYDEISSRVEELDPVASGLGTFTELPPDLKALIDAPQEKLKSYYKEKLLECFADVL